MNLNCAVQRIRQLIGPRIWFLLVLVYTLGCITAADEPKKEARQIELHIIKFVLPAAPEQKDAAPEVFVDGKSIGVGEKAFAQLGSIQFSVPSKIRIDLSDEIAEDAAIPYYPSFRRANFLHTWVSRGYELEFVSRGKVLKIHTWAFVKPKLRPGDPQFNESMGYAYDKTAWIIDGVRYENAPAAVNAMRTWEWTGEAMVWVLYPQDWAPEPTIRVIGDPTMDNYMNSVARKGVKMYHIGYGAPFVDTPANVPSR